MKEILSQIASTLIKADEIGFDGPKQTGTLMQDVLNGVYFWAGAIAIIIIIVAGFMYTLSNNDSSQLTKAKNAILGACIGLVIIGFAFAITNIVLGVF